MSSAGAPDLLGRAEGLRIAVVAASWHAEIMDGLLAGVERAAAGTGAVITVLRVPGSFELPIVAKRAAEVGFDGVVTLGVIIRGGTPHFEYVSQGVTDGLTRVAIDTGVPIGFGVLTCDDEVQARDRAGLPGSSEDKGAEAFWAVVGTITVLGEVAEGLDDVAERHRPYSGFTPN